MGGLKWGVPDGENVPNPDQIWGDPYPDSLGSCYIKGTEESVT